MRGGWQAISRTKKNGGMNKTLPAFRPFGRFSRWRPQTGRGTSGKPAPQAHLKPKPMTPSQASARPRVFRWPR